MRFGKLIWSNINKTISNYIIYWLFDIIIIFLLYAGSFIGNSYSDILVSNSLPVIILIIAITVLCYVNKLIVAKKGKEFAIYMLIGLSKNKIIFIYVAENLGILLLAFLVGVPLGLCYSYFGISGRIVTDSFSKVSLHTLKEFTMYFIILCLFTIFISIYFVNKNSIKDFLTIHLKPEKKKHHNYLIRKVILLLSLIVLFVMILLNIEYMLSIAFLVVAGILYISNELIFDSIIFIRKKKIKWLINKDRLYKIGKLLRKHRSKVIIYTVLNICFVVSACSFITGYVFKNSDNIIISSEIDKVMGHIQIYISILFWVTICSIINLNQSIDMVESKRDYYILMYIGRDKKLLSNIIINEICLNGGLSIGAAIPVLIIGCLFVRKFIVNISILLVLFEYIFICILILLVCEFILYYSVSTVMLNKIFIKRH